MNKLLFGLLLLCSYAGFSQSEAECLRFHNGTFKFPDPQFKNIVVTRTENWQSETDATDDSEIAGTIEWTTPCKYVLTFKTQKNAKVEHMIGKKITTEILEINGNECKIRFNLESEESLEVMMVKTK